MMRTWTFISTECWQRIYHDGQPDMWRFPCPRRQGRNCTKGRISWQSIVTKTQAANISTQESSFISPRSRNKGNSHSFQPLTNLDLSGSLQVQLVNSRIAFPPDCYYSYSC